MVGEWLENGYLQCPLKLMKMYETSKKQDDLADAMMLGVCYLQWMETTRLYIKTKDWSNMLPK